MVMVEIRQRRVDLFGTQIAMLAQQFFRRPAVMVMFGSKVLDLVTRGTDARDSVIIDNNVRINCGGTQFNVPSGEKQPSR